MSSRVLLPPVSLLAPASLPPADLPAVLAVLLVPAVSPEASNLLRVYTSEICSRVSVDSRVVVWRSALLPV